MMKAELGEVGIDETPNDFGKEMNRYEYSIGMSRFDAGKLLGVSAMRAVQLLVGLLAVLAFSGCDQLSVQPDRVGVPLSPSADSGTGQGNTAGAAVTSAVAGQATGQVTIPAVSATEKPGVVLRLTSTPSNVSPDVCSPLQEHGIDALEKIVSDPYHPPAAGRDERHHGVDFAYYRDGVRKSIAGEGVTAVMPGKVAYVQSDRLPYGNMIIIESTYSQVPAGIRKIYGVTRGLSVYHLYAHLQNEPFLQPGDKVACGEPIGEVGKSGYNVVNAHLHLEIRVGPGNTIFAPMAYYDTHATSEEQASYLLWRTSGAYRHCDPMILLRFARMEMQKGK